MTDSNALRCVGARMLASMLEVLRSAFINRVAYKCSYQRHCSHQISSYHWLLISMASLSLYRKRSAVATGTLNGQSSCHHYASLIF
ncbi:hypothetical protein HanRHA438_Chr16g0743781 [Helianthus annuus]|nr:hypothetical protein HanIR_Chr16g0795291 [Helianthus annuus]KAJ0834453.1 hypothetical protein HanRHA438_Chr16g0743781 [Helianthus annuus]